MNKIGHATQVEDAVIKNPKNNEESFFWKYLKIGAIALAIIFVLHTAFVILIGNNLYDVVMGLVPQQHKWWFKGFGILGFLAFAVASACIAFYFYKSFFSKKAGYVLYSVLGVTFAFSVLGQYLNRDQELEESYICTDKPNSYPYVSSKSTGTYAKKSLCVKADGPDFIAAAKSIADGQFPNQVIESDPEKLTQLQVSHAGKKIIYVSSKKEGDLFVFYIGAGIGNNSEADFIDFLKPATQEQLKSNVKTLQDRNKNQANNLAEAAANSAMLNAEKNRIKEDQDLKKKLVEEASERESKKLAAELEEKRQAFAKKRAAEEDTERRKQEVIDMSREKFKNEYIKNHTEKIVFTFSGLRSKQLPAGYVILEKTDDVRISQDGMIEAWIGAFSRDKHVVIAPGQNYPFPYPTNSEFYKSEPKSSDLMQGKNPKPVPDPLPPQMQKTTSGIISLEITFYERLPPKPSFSFPSGMSGNRVKDAKIRIRSVGCDDKITLSVNDGLFEKLCNYQKDVYPGDVYKIDNQTGGEIFSNNISAY
jgi:hypothetical protein